VLAEHPERSRATRGDEGIRPAARRLPRRQRQAGVLQGGGLGRPGGCSEQLRRGASAAGTVIWVVNSSPSTMDQGLAVGG
jgi:hypothetical protein